MATFPKPSYIAAQYFQFLKSLKPSLNINDANSDFVIRGNAFAGLISGLFGDQANVNGDTFISSMRSTALDLKGADLGLARQQATAAASTEITLTGTVGTAVGVGALTFLYAPTGLLYVNTTGGTIGSGGTLVVGAQALTSGQAGNIAAPDTFTIASPPTGVTATATITVALTGGADLESDDSYRARLLTREQNAPAGGNSTDYPAFAFAALSSVRSAKINRFGRGLGTVDVYITTGTTDIDTAVTNGDAVSRVPSTADIATVQAYYDAHAPLTDSAVVYGPTQVSVAVSVSVVLATGLALTSIPASATYNPLGLTVQALIQREVGRVLYKLAVGGRVLAGGTQGYVVAADIEAGLDTWLSAVPDPVTGVVSGYLPILSDREVQPLNGSLYDLPISSSALALPGTVTVTVGGF